MKNSIIISASLIKSFLHKGDYREVCHKRIKELRIDRSEEEQPTKSQLYGLYFEGQILGSSAGGRIFELPRKNTGEKTVAQERIDIQVLKFRQNVIRNYLSIMPGINTQVVVYKKFSEGVFLSGEMDVFPTPIMYNGEMLRTTVIDIKLTENLDNDWGEFSWARVEDMDHVQMIMYNYLLRDFDIGLNKRLSPKIFENGIIRQEILPDLDDVPVFYWVYEHSKLLRNQLFKVGINNTRIAELKESVRKVVQIIRENDENGWKATPSFAECKRCPLNFQNGGTCKEATIIKEV
jgi:hypothetical protein